MKTKPKSTGKNAQIRFTEADLKRIGWLSRRFGGLDRTSVVKMAVNELERRERASLVRGQTAVPFSPAPGVGPFDSGRIVTHEYGNLAGGSQKDQNRG